jgi:uncharacterized protein
MELTESFVSSLTIDESKIIRKIADELNIRTNQVSAVIELVAEGCTIPFISRYRKERTGSLDEVQVRESTHKYQAYKNLEERRLEVIRGIFALGKLDQALFDNIQKAQTLTEIDDIWSPYKKKKKTRGMLALERGLGKLSDIMVSQDEAAVDEAAPSFVREVPENPELSVPTAREAVQGAMDIVAERMAQDPDNRAAVKKFYLSSGKIRVKGVGDEAKKASSTYQMYWDYTEPLSTLKPHRVLAINRGEREGELAVSLEVDEDGAVSLLQQRITTFNATIARRSTMDCAVSSGLPSSAKYARTRPRLPKGTVSRSSRKTSRTSSCSRPSRGRACSAWIRVSGPAPSARRSTRPANSSTTS